MGIGYSVSGEAALRYLYLRKLSRTKYQNLLMRKNFYMQPNFDTRVHRGEPADAQSNLIYTIVPVQGIAVCYTCVANLLPTDSLFLISEFYYYN